MPPVRGFITTAAAEVASPWPFACASAMPSRIAFSAARWIRASIVSFSVGSCFPCATSSGPAMRPARVDAEARAHEARAEERVVRRLDAGLADDLSRLRVRVARRCELALAHLAEQAEELRAERALRIRARRLPRAP